MSHLNQAIVSSLTTRYTKLAGAVRDLAAPLSEAQFWAKPFPFGNSFGHLVLHLTGNLNYYIGAQIAGTDYVRDRPKEFTDAAPPSKSETLKKFDEAIAMVEGTIRAQSAEDWSKSYAATGSEAKDRFEMVLQCATHLHHHIGQMMYLGLGWHVTDLSDKQRTRRLFRMPQRKSFWMYNYDQVKYRTPTQWGLFLFLSLLFAVLGCGFLWVAVKEFRSKNELDTAYIAFAAMLLGGAVIELPASLTFFYRRWRGEITGYFDYEVSPGAENNKVGEDHGSDHS